MHVQPDSNLGTEVPRYSFVMPVFNEVKNRPLYIVRELDGFDTGAQPVAHAIVLSMSGPQPAPTVEAPAPTAPWNRPF